MAGAGCAGHTIAGAPFAVATASLGAGTGTVASTARIGGSGTGVTFASRSIIIVRTGQDAVITTAVGCGQSRPGPIHLLVLDAGGIIAAAAYIFPIAELGRAGRVQLLPGAGDAVQLGNVIA